MNIYITTILFISFRLLGDGKIAAPILNMAGLPGLPGKKDDNTIISILNNEGEIIKSFSELKEYDNPLLTGMANGIFLR